jgi:mannose-6-phosphate isomerase-like protein (cupin superfamily)
MNAPSLIDLFQIAKDLSGDYENRIVAEVNDHVIRLSRMTAPYFWHCHPNSDETFLGIDGVVLIELEGEGIELAPGRLFTVPRGVWHRTSPRGARSINLTIERAGIETVRRE